MSKFKKYPVYRINFTIESKLVIDPNEQMIEGIYCEYELLANGYCIMKTTIPFLATEACNRLNKLKYVKQKAILITHYKIRGFNLRLFNKENIKVKESKNVHFTSQF